MQEEQLKAMAGQLRKPEGPEGIHIGKWMNDGNAFMNQSTIKALNLQPHDNLLEIGMGNGFFVKDILTTHDSIQYTGCDFSSVMVEESIQNNKTFVEQGRAKFFLNTADQLPFTNNSFNKIFTVNTVYFWEDTSATFKELSRVLSATGELLIAIRPKHVMLKIPMTKYGFSMFDKEELCTLVQSNSFSIVDIQETVEPSFDFNGQTITLEHLIVRAIKTKK